MSEPLEELHSDIELRDQHIQYNCKQIEQFVHANLQRTTWSDHEQSTFFSLAQRHAQQSDDSEWNRIAKDMNRSPLDIKLFSHSLFINANADDWTDQDMDMLVQAINEYPPNMQNRMEAISAALPHKHPVLTKRKFDQLNHDMDKIGILELVADGADDDDDQSETMSMHTGGGGGGKMVVAKDNGNAHKTAERRKGVPWTEEEHRQFLIGLEKYGKGDWRSIATNCVITRTPTQVASHAQKYFIRQTSTSRERRRNSIHDITNASGKANKGNGNNKAKGGNPSQKSQSKPPDPPKSVGDPDQDAPKLSLVMDSSQSKSDDDRNMLSAQVEWQSIDDPGSSLEESLGLQPQDSRNESETFGGGLEVGDMY